VDEMEIEDWSGLMAAFRIRKHRSATILPPEGIFTIDKQRNNSLPNFSPMDLDAMCKWLMWDH
jgi:hypothetical protein